MKTNAAVIFSLVLALAVAQSEAQEPTLIPNPYMDAASWSHVPSSVVQASHCDECGGVADSCECHGGDSGLFHGLHGRRWCNGLWGDVEYLLWWSKERTLPPLVTTSPAGTAEAQAGVLGLPSTTILFGDEEVGDDPNSGFRVTLGTWLDNQRSTGLGARFFGITAEDDFSQSSDLAGNPILGRPFYNAELDIQDALLLSFPGESHGNVNVSAENEVRGFDIVLRKLLLQGYCNRFDLVGGYTNVRVEDSVQVNDRLISDDPARLPLGSTIDTEDRFEVRNQFDGGFVGLMATAEDGRLTWKLLAKIAFGNMNQRARISGTTHSAIPGPGGVVSSTSDFGLLALPTNIGTYETDEFAMIPEINVNVGYRCTDNFHLTLGYSFIYWTEMALAGDIIDTTINPTQMTGPLVGAARPAFPGLTSDDFWYSGLSVGGTLRF